MCIFLPRTFRRKSSITARIQRKAFMLLKIENNQMSSKNNFGEISGNQKSLKIPNKGIKRLRMFGKASGEIQKLFSPFVQYSILCLSVVQSNEMCQATMNNGLYIVLLQCCILHMSIMYIVIISLKESTYINDARC